MLIFWEETVTEELDPGYISVKTELALQFQEEDNKPGFWVPRLSFLVLDIDSDWNLLNALMIFPN